MIRPSSRTLRLESFKLQYFFINAIGESIISMNDEYQLNAFKCIFEAWKRSTKARKVYLLRILFIDNVTTSLVVLTMQALKYFAEYIKDIESNMQTIDEICQAVHDCLVKQDMPYGCGKNKHLYHLMNDKQITVTVQYFIDIQEFAVSQLRDYA